MHTHRWVIHIGGSFGQPGVILNEDRWRWIPASQLSVCGSREQNEMHFLCITQCCIPLISLHFIWTSVLLLQYSYITAPSLLFSQIQFQIQFQCNYYLVTLYQSGLFLWCFYSAFFTCWSLSAPSVFVVWKRAKGHSVVYLLLCWHIITLNVQ